MKFQHFATKAVQYTPFFSVFPEKPTNTLYFSPFLRQNRTIHSIFGGVLRWTPWRSKFPRNSRRFFPYRFLFTPFTRLASKPNSYAFLNHFCTRFFRIRSILSVFHSFCAKTVQYTSFLVRFPPKPQNPRQFLAFFRQNRRTLVNF